MIGFFGRKEKEMEIIPESKLLTSELKEQVKAVFSKLERTVYLYSILDESEKSQELGCFLLELSTLSDKVKLSFFKKGESKELSKELEEEKVPATGLYDEDKVFTGIAFYGIPAGQEFNSLILAIYNVGGKGQEIEKRLVKKLEKIKNPVHFQIFVSLACHHCPKMVVACQRLSALSPYIKADMIDASLYPEVIEQYKIERVPMTIVNGEEVYMGVKPIETLVEIACDHGMVKKRRFGK